MPYGIILKNYDFVYKSQQIEKFFFPLVFKILKYPHTRTEKLNLNQEKNALLCHPLPFWSKLEFGPQSAKCKILRKDVCVEGGGEVISTTHLWKEMDKYHLKGYKTPQL